MKSAKHDAGTALSIEEQRLLEQWQARVARGEFSAGVTSVGMIGVMGRSGDEQVAFPRITSLAALDTLTPDEQFAVRYAERVVNAKRGAGRVLAGFRPGSGYGSIITRFDPTSPEDILILTQAQGG